MGLKGAPAYFQAMMQSVVLPDMMYHSIEVYLDDLIVFAKDEEEYLDRLEQLLKRLRDRRITVNQKKCRLGMSSIEYVGHVIDKEGLSYSPEKVEKVLDFPPPRVATELRSFIGLANYFSNKVENMQWRLAPLRNLEEKFRAIKILQWSDETRQQFEHIELAINRHRKIFFVDNNHGTVY